MANEEHHEHLIKEVSNLFDPILTNSTQAIYIYLDDAHKICNQKFADLMGYESIEDWIANETPIDDIIARDQNEVIEAFVAATQNYESSALSVTLNTKDQGEVDVDLIMVPFSYQGEIFVIHYILEKALN
jgi:hypothetical protein